MTQFSFPDAYARMLEATGESSQSGLARALGVSQSSVWDAQRRAEGIPANWLVTLVEKYSVNPVWIKTGQGSKQLSRSLRDHSLEELFVEIGKRMEVLAVDFVRLMGGGPLSKKEDK